MAEHDLPICQDTPEILQFVRMSADNFWNTFEPPHSGGSIPEKLLLARRAPNPRVCHWNPNWLAESHLRENPPVCGRIGQESCHPLPLQTVLYLRKWASVMVFAAAFGPIFESDMRLC